MLLAGDIGGTKTILALFSPDSGTLDPLKEASYPNSEYGSFEDILAEFMGTAGYSVRRASIGIAGPVSQGRAATTNLPWDVTESGLARILNISEVRLLNDLEAIAYAVPHLKSSDLHILNPGEGKDRESLAVIAPGTGLGEAFLTWSNNRYLAHPSEGGHTDFAPATPEENKLLGYLQERSDHVSVESVCSGRGIPNIYSFFKDTGSFEESVLLKESLASVTDPTPVIIDAATDKDSPCPLCKATLEMFVSILGSEAGNLALKVMATGGVFVGGGIPPRIIPALEAGSFMMAFSGKGRMRAIMKKIPVRVIMNPGTALMGAACYGFKEWGRSSDPQVLTTI